MIQRYIPIHCIFLFLVLSYSLVYHIKYITSYISCFSLPFAFQWSTIFLQVTIAVVGEHPYHANAYHSVFEVNDDPWLYFILLFFRIGSLTFTDYQPVREAVNDRGLFTAGWFGVREKHCSRLVSWAVERALRPCLVGLLALAFGPKSQKPNQRGCFLRVLFQKQLLFRSSFLKAGLTLLLAFGFLLFEIGGIKSSSIVVSREIKIKGIFYTCLTKQLSAFLQLTAHSSFSTAHSPQQLFPTVTAQPNRALVADLTSIATNFYTKWPAKVESPRWDANMQLSSRIFL